MSLEVHIRKQLGHFCLNVDLDLKDGTTAILGASGCGKSLTLLSIAGVVRPDAGFIALNGRVLFDSSCRVDMPPQKRHVGCLFQHGALFPNMSVLENIACGAPRSLPRRERLAMAQNWAKDMHLDGLAKHRPSELSGGQAQRVALARVLIGKPEILLLDEPFSALDSFLREQLVTDLKSLLASRNQDALLVTHSRDEAYELGSTLAIMENGRVLTTGAMQEVFDDPKTKTGAILTGCKNIVEARKAGPRRVQIPAWGIELEAAQEVGDKTEAIGIRAHQFSPSIIENAYPIHVVEAVEEPFAWILKFRYTAQNDESPHVWWRFSKSSHQVTREVDSLGVYPRDILLLASR